MSIDLDITNLDDHPIINLSRGSSGSKQKSANFGEGIELLMNEKRKNDGGNKSMSNDIDLADLNNLEDELNNLSSTSDIRSTKIKSKSGLFNEAWSGKAWDGGGGGGDRDGDSIKLKFKDDDEESLAGSILSLHDDYKPSVGKSTADKSSFEESQTWDGFSKFNNVPVNPDREMPNNPRLSAEELLAEKFKILRTLEHLEKKKGVQLTKKYTMESSLAEMKGELAMIYEEKERSNSCKFQGRMLMAGLTSIEYLNKKLDPFDINLDGWAEQVNENIADFDEIFAELHEKYKSRAKLAPELKLIFQLASSGMMVHMSNTMFKSAMPGMDDIMRQNPELAQQFTQAAVNSMSQQNPGFGGFMSNFMPAGGGGAGGSGGAGVNFNNMNGSRPPAPMPTQQSKSERYAPPTNRPDLNRARGGDDGINIQERFEPVGRQPQERSNKRPEMKGPSDIGDLLAGLKTKTINVQPPSVSAQKPQQQPQQQPQQPQQPQQVNSLRQNINTVNNSLNNVPMQKSTTKLDSVTKFSDLSKSKRKSKSDKNTMSLDI